MQREIPPHPARRDARRGETIPVATRDTMPQEATIMGKTTTKPRATKKFKSLVAVLGSDEAAVTAWNNAHPDNQIAVKGAPKELPEAVQTLVDAGFTVEEARQALADAGESTPAKALTSAEKAEALIAQSGYVPVRGRVYSNGAIIESQARVLKTGKPEVIRNSGDKRIKAVAVWRTDEGDSIAVQNLGEPN